MVQTVAQNAIKMAVKVNLLHIQYTVDLVSYLYTLLHYSCCLNSIMGCKQSKVRFARPYSNNYVTV